MRDVRGEEVGDDPEARAERASGLLRIGDVVRRGPRAALRAGTGGGGGGADAWARGESEGGDDFDVGEEEAAAGDSGIEERASSRGSGDEAEGVTAAGSVLGAEAPTDALLSLDSGFRVTGRVGVGAEEREGEDEAEAEAEVVGLGEEVGELEADESGDEWSAPDEARIGSVRDSAGGAGGGVASNAGAEMEDKEGRVGVCVGVCGVSKPSKEETDSALPTDPDTGTENSMTASVPMP